MQSVRFFGQFVICIALSVNINYGMADSCDKKHVTITEMKDIFIGRCFDFQTTVHPEIFCANGLKNCTDLWEKFTAAFIDEPQCNVTADLYTSFIDAASYNITGKQMFYVELYEFAQRYSSRGERYTIVEDTLIGYLLDGLRFCGGKAGENASEWCERYNPVTCPYTAGGSFWEAASINFANNAEGHVYALVTSARDPIIRNVSYFFKYEVPNFRDGVVTQLTTFLINDSPSSKRELCKNEESLKLLKALVEEKNIVFECEENPRDVVLLYCMDNPSTELCTSKSLFATSISTSLTGNIFNLFLAVIVAVLKNLL